MWDSLQDTWLMVILLSQPVMEDKYVVTQNIRDASIVIKNTKEPPLTLTIHLTSPLVREEMERATTGGKLLHQDLSFFSYSLLQQGGKADNQAKATRQDRYCLLGLQWS